MRCQLLLSVLLTGILLQAGDTEAYDYDLDRYVQKWSRDGSFANIDKLIDDNIGYIRKALKDPGQLRDKRNSLTRHIFLALNNGITRHISQIRRTAPCSLEYNNKVLQFVGNFGWDKLDFNYDYLLQVLFLKKSGVVVGNLTQVNVNLKLDINLKDYKFILRDFKFTNAGTVNLRLTGQKLSEKIANLFLKVYTKIGKRSVLNKIQSSAVESIVAGIDELNGMLGRGQRHFTFVNEVSQIFQEVDVA